MSDDAPGRERTDDRGRGPYRVRLPGFIPDEEIGLGEVIKRATSSMGITPCGGCKGRAAALDRLFVFRGRRPA